MRLTEILAAIDFSSSSTSAARCAYALARKHDAALLLLHVDHPPELARRMAEHAAAHHRGGMFVEEAYLRQRDETLREQLGELARTFDDVRVRLVVVRGGEPSAAIARHALADGTDLVVIGPHGDGDRRHAWLGSTALQVTASVPCAVLIARTRGEGALARRPLIALPPDRPFAAHLDLAMALSAADAELSVMHVHERGRVSSDLEAARGLTERVRQLVAAHRPVHAEVVEADDAAHALVDRVARREHDLVVVGRSETPGPSPAPRLGSIARRLLEDGRASIAIVGAAAK